MALIAPRIRVLRMRLIAVRRSVMRTRLMEETVFAINYGIYLSRKRTVTGYRIAQVLGGSQLGIRGGRIWGVEPTVDFVTLRCGSCGASLEVYNDVELFACGYCRSQMEVRRRGGTVSLQALSDEVRDLREVAERTQAELELRRVEEELEKLQEEIRRDEESRNASNGGVLVGVLVLGVLGVASLGNGSPVLGLVMLGVAGWLGYVAWGKADARSGELEGRRSALRKKIVEVKRKVGASDQRGSAARRPRM